MNKPWRSIGMRHFLLLIVALTAFMLGLIWMAGTGEAINKPLSPSILLASDSIHINVNDVMATDKDEVTTSDERETLFKQIKKFDQVVYDIKNRYMEDIDTKELINSGIRGMLEDLDRFSVLMEKQSYDRLMESTHGKYEGLGMEIDARDNYIIVVTPMEGMPAYRMGLRSGDQIYEIDGKSTFKMSTSDAAKLMRGPAGTTVNLKVMREGLAEPLDFDVERAVIELKSVHYYGVIDGTKIGYIRLIRFAEETSQELRDAISELKAAGIEGLIFDLRYNGGGLLQEAVETSELFLDEGRLIVYTRGRLQESEKRSYSRRVPMFPDKPLIVLVNDGTASASEIVSGAIQDWDRGIIMGTPTYGKGLVQQLFPVGSDDDVALKLTTAKYYIPSGRCIQKPETSRKSTANSESDLDEQAADTITTDTLKTSPKEVYFTNAGRPVYGGGGILPDIEVADERILEPIEINLERKQLFFDFAVVYVAEHPDVTRQVEITDDILDSFKDFLKKKDFTYKTSLEISLEKMKEAIKEEGKDSVFATALGDFEDVIRKEKETDFDRSKDYIKRAIRREIIAKIAGQRGVYEDIFLKTDPVVLKALEVIQNKDEYARILREGQAVGSQSLIENK
jgi:carboxyl-terminal processing protease